MIDNLCRVPIVQNHFRHRERRNINIKVPLPRFRRCQREEMVRMLGEWLVLDLESGSDDIGKYCTFSLRVAILHRRNSLYRMLKKITTISTLAGFQLTGAEKEQRCKKKLHL